MQQQMPGTSKPLGTRLMAEPPSFQSNEVLSDPFCFPLASSATPHPSAAQFGPRQPGGGGSWAASTIYSPATQIIFPTTQNTFSTMGKSAHGPEAGPDSALLIRPHEEISRSFAGDLQSQQPFVAVAAPAEHNQPANNLPERRRSAAPSMAAHLQSIGNDASPAGAGREPFIIQQSNSHTAVGSGAQDVRDIDRFMEAEVSRVSQQIREIQSALRGSAARHWEAEASQPSWEGTRVEQTEMPQAAPFPQESNSPTGKQPSTHLSPPAQPNASQHLSHSPSPRQISQKDSSCGSLSNARDGEHLSSSMATEPDQTMRRAVARHIGDTVASRRSDSPSTREEKDSYPPPSSLRSFVEDPQGRSDSSLGREKRGNQGGPRVVESAPFDDPAVGNARESQSVRTTAEAAEDRDYTLASEDKRHSPKSGSAAVGGLADSIGFSGAGSDAQSTGFLRSSNGSFAAMRQTPAFGLRSSWGSGSGCSSSRDFPRRRLLRGVSAGNLRELEGHNARLRRGMVSSHSEENLAPPFQQFHEDANLPMTAIPPAWQRSSSSSSHEFDKIVTGIRSGNRMEHQDSPGDPDSGADTTRNYSTADSKAVSTIPSRTSTSNFGSAATSSPHPPRRTDPFVGSAISDTRGMGVFSYA